MFIIQQLYGSVYADESKFNKFSIHAAKLKISATEQMPTKIKLIDTMIFVEQDCQLS